MTALAELVAMIGRWWTGHALSGEVAGVHRQVRVSELEAGFSLACTLAVCVHQEWGGWDQVGAAVTIPVAMAFSVHGLNNARGLGLKWGPPYLLARVAVIVLGIAYSYQHYYHFLGPLEVFGFDLRPLVAVTMELLTVSALMAHEAHSARLGELTNQPDPSPGTGGLAKAREPKAEGPGHAHPTAPAARPAPTSGLVPVPAAGRVALFDAPTGALSLTQTGVRSTNNTKENHHAKNSH